MQTNLLVVGIKELFKSRIKRLIAADMSGQKKGFKEPSRVRQMPLDGARVGHRLQHLVFCREWLRQRERRRAHLLKLWLKRTTNQLLGLAGVHSNLRVSGSSRRP